MKNDRLRKMIFWALCCGLGLFGKRLVAPIANMITPTLTTVSYQYSSLAKTAFEVMMDYVENPGHRCQQYEVNSSLTVRETTMSQKTTINGASYLS